MLRCCWRLERRPTWTPCDASWLPYERRGALLRRPFHAGVLGSEPCVTPHSVCRHDLVQLLLSYGADVNCYFRVISNTLFPTALQYCLNDPVMMRLLLNGGYQAYKYVCGYI